MLPSTRAARHSVSRMVLRTCQPLYAEPASATFAYSLIRKILSHVFTVRRYVYHAAISMTIYHAAAYTHLPDPTHCPIPLCTCRTLYAYTTSRAVPTRLLDDPILQRTSKGASRCGTRHADRTHGRVQHHNTAAHNTPELGSVLLPVSL